MNISLDNIYILNPAYFLRNDLRRAVIGTYDFPRTNGIPFEKNALYIIHPMHAQLLSFFDGTQTLGQCIQAITQYFLLSENDVENILTHYINNKEVLHIQIEDTYVALPPHVLVEAKNIIRKETYTPKDFLIEGEVDLCTVRLYRPLKIVFELTMNCYTDCIYCYADRRNIKAKKLMSFDNICKIIREAYEIGIPSIEINGGEVMLHPHINDILEEMSKYGYSPFISTKIPLTEEQLIFLKQKGIKNIQISIDSVYEDTLIKLLKVKTGYLQKLLNTITLLDEMQFDWQVNVVLTQFNSSIEKELYPLLMHLVSYQYLKSIKINPVGFSMYKDESIFNNLRITLDEFNHIKTFVLDVANKYPNVEFIFPHPNCKTDYLLDNKKKLFPKRSICSANRSGFVILPNGEVSICEELYWNPHFLIGDVSQQSILDIWTSPKAKQLFFVQQHDFSNESQCKTCNAFSECRHKQGVCWKMVIMAYGQDKWDFPDPSCPYASENMNSFYYT